MKKGFTVIEALLVLVVILILCIFPWVIYKLFEAKDMLTTVKWGCLLISMSCAGASSKSKG